MNRHCTSLMVLRVCATSLALLAASANVFGQYGNNPPPAKPNPPAAADPPPPAEAQPPAAPAAAPGQPLGQRVDVQPAEVKWLDRVPKEDRAALDELLGWAPPKFASDLQWIGRDALTWDDLRGKVVVIQSFTTANVAGRKWPERIAQTLKAFEAKDLRLIALHTPEDADKAKDFLAKKPVPEHVAVAVDPKGAFCDALAIYKHAINIVVDRNGAVRYAALNANGLEEAVKALVAEPFNQNLIVAQREDAAADASEASAFPPVSGVVDHANDIRGKRAPEFYVDEWLNSDPPNARDKVVVVDFWATNCGPCIASIPHMNALATKFRDDLVCVGISHEKPPDFEKGMSKLKAKSITLKSFEYAVALDPSRRMYGAVNVSAIPHCIVMDRNWIVRWQGHPMGLNDTTLEKIIRADKSQTSGSDSGGTPKPGAPKRKRWTNDA